MPKKSCYVLDSITTISFFNIFLLLHFNHTCCGKVLLKINTHIVRVPKERKIRDPNFKQDPSAGKRKM